jgi:hypothetical protein
LFIGGLVIEARVFPTPIIPALDIFKCSWPGLSPRVKINMVHQFTFEGFEKALGYRVIPTVELQQFTGGLFQAAVLCCSRSGW